MTPPRRDDAPGRIEERLIHEGRIVRLSVDTVRLPDGRIAERELVHHAGASAILPILSAPDLPDPEILLIRQWRYATSGEILEIPAGVRASPRESFRECAHRELREETGYRAGRLEPLVPLWTAPGFTNERVHLFVAWDLDEGERELDPDEFVEEVKLPLSRALDAVRGGRITDAKTLAAILWLAHLGPHSHLGPR
ncbi:MAG: NUDIX hydrolase [Longimicrobiales bacterium]|nr:NUDIX hydrolase [Longimicrobiales bacterium]